MSQELLSRIEHYLGNGGLVNPEMMEHDKVRDLILDCRDALTRKGGLSTDIVHLLRMAEEEIRGLRRRNEILSAKVEVMDSFMCVLHTKPAEHIQAMAEDISWKLRKKAEEIESQLPKEN